MESIKVGHCQNWGIMIVDDSGCLAGYDERAKELLALEQTKDIGKNIDAILSFPFSAQVNGIGNSSNFVAPIMQNVGNQYVMLYPKHTTFGRVNYLTILIGTPEVTEHLFCPNEVSLMRHIKGLEKLINAILECSHDGMIITDKDGNFTHWNKRLEEIYLTPRAEVRSGRDMVARGVYQRSSSLQALQEEQTVSVVNVSRKGQQILSTATPFRDTAGNIAGAVVNVRDLTELRELASKIEECRFARESMKSLIEEVQKENFAAKYFVCHSERMQQVLAMTKKVADTDEIVLITGETGVGKSLFAELIHKSSPRREKPFIPINSAAIPESLMESEFFGYEKGAFTGASVHGKPGLFELAASGTLFLDEISEIPLIIQAKLLDAIERRQVRRIGGKASHSIDTRIIAATNQDLESLIKEGSFRKDLYYRINVIKIEVPPLRERGEDIILLAHSFLEHYCEKHRKRIHFGRGVDKILTDYNWPGNVRELQNLILRLVLNTYDEVLTVNDVAGTLFNNHPRSIVKLAGLPPLKEAVAALEQQLIQRAIETHGSTYKAARVLGISQSTVVRKMQKRLDIHKTTGIERSVG